MTRTGGRHEKRRETQRASLRGDVATPSLPAFQTHRLICARHQSEAEAHTCMELFGLLKSSSISARCVRASSRSKEPREPRAFITVKRLYLLILCGERASARDNRLWTIGGPGSLEEDLCHGLLVSLAGRQIEFTWRVLTFELVSLSTTAHPSRRQRTRGKVIKGWSASNACGGKVCIKVNKVRTNPISIG